MKVLIVGEFSAFAKNLSVGINSIDGNEAVVFANDDGFKKIKQTSLSYTYKSPHNIKLFGFEIRGTHKIVGYFQYMKFKKDLKKFKNYFDVIFIISYTLIREEHNKTNPQFSINDLKYAIKKDGKIFMSSCGGDVAFFEFAKQNKRFSCVYKDLNIPRMPLYYKQKDLIKDIVKGVIPMSYQYHEAYRLYGKEFPLLNPIQLPFDVSTVPHKSEYLKNKKITIFNGALRPTKGTKFIVEALQKISEKYSDRIIIREDRLPYNQFLNF